MEQRRNQEVVNMEEPIVPIRSSNSFFDSFITSCNNTNHPSTSFLDLENHWNIGSIGFMDLLGVVDNDFCSSNTTITPTTTGGADGVFQEESGHRRRHRSFLPPYKSDNPNCNYTTAAAAAPPESSDLLNAPTTPKSSSSVSSESIICAAALIAELPKPANDDEDEQQQQEKTKKHSLKPKKTNQKRQKQPRFAFMTKSEVDHLEDGYRWRKYGQKAVKNSPFPRSYYRCTSTSCNVKKRVERSFNDPSIVVTTYEGQHIHPTPMIHRPSPQSSAFLFTNPTAVPTQITTLSQQLQFNNMMAPVHLNCGFTGNRDLFTGALGKRFSATPPSDDGLLQDIVPSTSTMRKEDIL